MGFGPVDGRDLLEPDDDVPLVGGAHQVVTAAVARKVPALSAALAKLGQLAGATLGQPLILFAGARWSGAESAEIGDALEALRELVHGEDVNDVARDVPRLLLFLGLDFASLRGPAATETERKIGLVTTVRGSASYLRFLYAASTASAAVVIQMVSSRSISEI